MQKNKIYLGDSLEILKTFPDESIDMCVTSPPYFRLRDYGIDGQMGLEETPEEYINNLVNVFSEVKRVMKKEGTLWVNIGDSYAGHNSVASNNGRCGMGTKREKVDNRIPNGCKNKDLIGIPWMLAFALRADGWYLRQDIIWNKVNSIPESVTDRCTKSHEYIFLLSKSDKYYFDFEAIQEEATGYDGRKDTKMHGSTKYKDANIMPDQKPNSLSVRGHERWTFKNGKAIRRKRDVWTVPTKPCKEAHFATFPIKLIEPCILSGCPENGIVLDPFMGSGSTAIAARLLGRNYVGCELNQKYIAIAEKRLVEEVGLFK